jgi:hypothetical protein
LAVDSNNRPPQIRQPQRSPHQAGKILLHNRPHNRPLPLQSKKPPQPDNNPQAEIQPLPPHNRQP